MFLNYFKTAVRTLFRHRFFSAINIFGLAVAMSICMVLIMLVADQVSYDRYNTNADRIYRVTTYNVDIKGNVTSEKMNAASALPVGPELIEKYTGIERIARFRRGFGNSWVKFENQDVNIPIAGFFADANALDFFQYELEYGDAATALKDPFTVVLTRSAANKLFKEENPVGKTIQVGELGIYTVTGVLRETNKKSHIVFEGLASMASANSLEESGKLPKVSDDWTTYWDGWTYIEVEEGKTKASIQNDLDRIYEQHIASITDARKVKMKFALQSLLDITPGNVTNNSIGPVMLWVIIYFLGGLALAILLASCFNFTNLSIARSLTRAREIGVRKVTGATRWQIFVQFISESIVVAFISLALALLLLIILKPMVLQLSFAQLFHWDLYSDTTVYALFAVFTLVVGIMAGLFPAVVLSAFQPVKVLKNLNGVKLLSRIGIRKVLLVLQFTVSLFFIISVLVMYNQLELFTHKDHGFNTRSNILIRLHNTSSQALKTELEKYNNITYVSAASHLPAATNSYGTSIKKTLENPDEINAGWFSVDADYMKNMNLKLLAGKFFDANNGKSNESFAVINETASKRMNYESPIDAIGETFVFSHDSTTKQIIGVVADYNHRDLTRAITPMLLLYQPDDFNVLQVAYDGPYEKASSAVESAWATINPALKVDYIEVESEITKTYEVVFGDLVKVLSFVSFFAILISCLGLLGMATYTTETRIKEISIRKVLGSSSKALILLLSKGYLIILGIAIIVGVPLAWFVNNLWLDLIAYHVNIGFGIISIGASMLILFGAITIGSQTIRATFIKAVDNLKSE